jgi:drug/metabolite transporter, DME family
MARAQILLAAVLFGTTGTAQALGPDGTTPATVGAARVLVGGALLFLALRALAAGAPRPAARWLALGAAGVAGYQLCFFAAVADTGVAVGTVVALGSAPALAGIAAWLLHRERLSARWAAATAVATAGVLLLVLGGGADAHASALGIVLALGAGASYAAYTLSSKALLAAGHGTESVMAWTFGLGALLLLPVLALGEHGWLGTGGGLALALFLGAVPTAAAYLLFAQGLRRLSPGETATLTLAEPVTAAALGAVVLGERLAGAELAGVVVVLTGLALLALPERGERVRGVPAPEAV